MGELNKSGDGQVYVTPPKFLANILNNPTVPLFYSKNKLKNCKCSTLNNGLIKGGIKLPGKKTRYRAELTLFIAI